jgi:hypothetical protein
MANPEQLTVFLVEYEPPEKDKFLKVKSMVEGKIYPQVLQTIVGMGGLSNIDTAQTPIPVEINNTQEKIHFSDIWVRLCAKPDVWLQ